MHAKATRFSAFVSGTPAVFGHPVHRIKKGVFQREKLFPLPLLEGRQRPRAFMDEWSSTVRLHRSFLGGGRLSFFRVSLLFRVGVLFRHSRYLCRLRTSLSLLGHVADHLPLGGFSRFFAIL